MSFACVAICASLSESFVNMVFRESVSAAISLSFAATAVSYFASSSSACLCFISAHRASVDGKMRWEEKEIRNIMDVPSWLRMAKTSAAL